jgi:hypothetical protein
MTRGWYRIVVVALSIGCATVAAAQSVAPTAVAPTGAAGEGTPPEPAPAAAATPAPTPEITWAVGSRLRGIFVPAWFLGAFMNHAQGLSSLSWGLDFTRRKGNLDLVFGLDIGWYGAIGNANWTGTGGFADDTYWTEFNSFMFTSLDMNLIWHYDFNDWIALRYGGGIGIGFLSGDMYRQLSGPACTSANVDSNLGQCGPGFAGGPARFAEDLGSYRVLPVVAVLLGVRFKLHRHAVVTVDAGFHDAFFFGAGGQYVF